MPAFAICLLYMDNYRIILFELSYFVNSLSNSFCLPIWICLGFTSICFLEISCVCIFVVPFHNLFVSVLLSSLFNPFLVSFFQLSLATSFLQFLLAIVIVIYFLVFQKNFFFFQFLLEKKLLLLF